MKKSGSNKFAPSAGARLFGVEICFCFSYVSPAAVHYQLWHAHGTFDVVSMRILSEGDELQEQFRSAPGSRWIVTVCFHSFLFSEQQERL
jgi:hypothetical protein